MLNDLKKRSDPKSPLLVEIAMIYVALADRDQAMIWLERGLKSGLIQGFSNGLVLMSYGSIRASRTLSGASAFHKP